MDGPNVTLLEQILASLRPNLRQSFFVNQLQTYTQIFILSNKNEPSQRKIQNKVTKPVLTLISLCEP